MNPENSDDQSQVRQTIKDNLECWMQFCFLAFVCFFILGIILALKISPILLTGFLIAYEVLLLMAINKHIHKGRFYILNLVLGNLINIASLILLVLGHSRFISVAYSSIPLFFSLPLAFFIEPRLSQPCKKLTRVAKLVFKTLTAITLILVGFKLDNKLGWSWSFVFWPFWVCAFGAGLYSTGVFIPLVGSLTSYFSGGTSFDSVLGPAYLFYVATSSTFAISYFLTNVHYLFTLNFSGIIVPLSLLELNLGIILAITFGCRKGLM